MTLNEIISNFYVNGLMGLGFGFGSIFWAVVLWLIFGKGGR